MSHTRHLYKFSLYGSGVMTFYMHEFFAYKITNPIPKDAKFVRLWVEEDRQMIFIVIEHPSFPAVEEGEFIPSYPAIKMDHSEQMFKDYVTENLLYLAMEKAIKEEEK